MKNIMFRHFAKYYHGHVYVYANGQTSWTNDGETQPWEPEHVKFERDADIKNMQNDNKCCKDCSERKPGCHAECIRYAEFKERLEKIKIERRKEYNKFNRYIYGINKNENK